MCYPGLIETLAAAPTTSVVANDEYLLLRRVRDRIAREPGTALDIERIAHSVGLAPRTLSRRFEIAYGRSPYHYLVALRGDPYHSPYTAGLTGGGA
ncbi:AraC family transcriptional regulator [Microlunatus sp. Gsoil 973]|jgi:transcriptional regulator GlxA family with amidase domain|uniref:AraC family transcriptional regulator n=1 Tax=Microlunatus sp. Gsoil 973 TaxID=2672569 RepID=UPI0012B48A49|nr:AraC family transcriptional regulator [Microlunatus sp. Gsoil 973]QGN32497.1 hypothetical protein GJV80_06435 [Microlunatus sp. Gsoil 973]